MSFFCVAIIFSIFFTLSIVVESSAAVKVRFVLILFVKVIVSGSEKASDTLVDIENIIGTEGNDTIFGYSETNFLNDGVLLS